MKQFSVETTQKIAIAAVTALTGISMFWIVRSYDKSVKNNDKLLEQDLMNVMELGLKDVQINMLKKRVEIADMEIEALRFSNEELKSELNSKKKKKA